MPFCTQCGTETAPQDRFCARCGAAQPVAQPLGRDPLSGISEHSACILCYIPVFGIIADVIFLVGQRFRHNFRVRFHAFQGLYLFVAWMIVHSAGPALLYPVWPGHVEHMFLGFMRLALILCWIYLLVQTIQNRDVRLPVIGDLAARSTQEQA